MILADRRALQADLLMVFQQHGISVAVGLTQKGVAIRSQDERVDAANIGEVTPYDAKHDLIPQHD